MDNRKVNSKTHYKRSLKKNGLLLHVTASILLAVFIL